MAPFTAQRYPVTIGVRVTWADGDVILDAHKGLNAGHALYLARLNWPGATVTLLSYIP